MPGRKQRKLNSSVYQIYFTSPESTGSTDLNDFLIKGYAKQIKERNSTTGQDYEDLVLTNYANYSIDNVMIDIVLTISS